jgi:hypothetical protein
MRLRLIIPALLIIFVLAGAGVAQQKRHRKQPAAAQPAQDLAATLEAKVTQAWDDYKNKRKDAFAEILTDDFVTVGEDGAGPRDRQSQLDEIDQVAVRQYVLRDFSVKPIGADGALVTYKAEYSGSQGKQPFRERMAVGEIWVNRGGAWKCMYAQMTRII